MNKGNHNWQINMWANQWTWSLISTKEYDKIVSGLFAFCQKCSVGKLKFYEKFFDGNIIQNKK